MRVKRGHLQNFYLLWIIYNTNVINKFSLIFGKSRSTIFILLINFVTTRIGLKNCVQRRTNVTFFEMRRNLILKSWIHKVPLKFLIPSRPELDICKVATVKFWPSPMDSCDCMNCMSYYLKDWLLRLLSNPMLLSKCLGHRHVL